MSHVSLDFVRECMLDLTENANCENIEYVRALHELWGMIAIDGQEDNSPFIEDIDILYPKQSK